MNRSIRVHLAPALVDPANLRRRTVLVIDLLRATTTISFAPVVSIDGEVAGFVLNAKLWYVLVKRPI